MTLSCFLSLPNNTWEVDSIMYAMYLRKSRADLDAEARGEGETLARHRKQLLDLADVRHLTIGKVYEEIVSGDTIADRPQMQALLRDVEAGMWSGVLVVDVDRLGRGDSIDQGTILKTFKYSGTKIVTVYKTYDPNNEIDEEFFEFNQQIARSEFRRIKRRMWAGRIAATREGKYLSPKPPFGYARKKLDGQKGWTLEIVPDQADAVRMIFDLYVNGERGVRLGMGSIADRVNRLGFKTFHGSDFTPGMIRQMLGNPTYIGKIRWNQRRQQKRMVDGVEVTRRDKSDEYFEVDGLHDAIIDPSVFAAAQARLAQNSPHKHNNGQLLNPFAGLMYCPICGKSIIRTPVYHRNTDGEYRCTTKRCATSSISTVYVEDAVLAGLREWLAYADSVSVLMPPAHVEDTATDIQRKQLELHIATLERQIASLHDFLEQGIYDADTFISRNRLLSERLKTARSDLDALQHKDVPTDEQAIVALAPQIAHVLDAWPSCSTAAEKNELIRTVVRRILYHKTRRCFRNDNPADYLTISLHPVLDYRL